MNVAFVGLDKPRREVGRVVVLVSLICFIICLKGISKVCLSSYFERLVKVSHLVGGLPQLLVGKEQAGGVAHHVAHHALLLPTEPVVVRLPRIVWVHHSSGRSR